jgi:hypothetical protein
VTPTAADLAEVLSRHAYRYANEVGLHAGLEQAMLDADLHPRPEVHLGPAGRIDFLVDRVGVEVKVAGETEPLLRQLTRYAGRSEIDELLVVTTRRKHRQLPSAVSGKPVHVLVVGGV